jgi:hypothetical protein
MKQVLKESSATGRFLVERVLPNIYRQDSETKSRTALVWCAAQEEGSSGKWRLRIWTGFVCVRIGFSGKLLVNTVMNLQDKRKGGEISD